MRDVHCLSRLTAQSSPSPVTPTFSPVQSPFRTRTTPSSRHAAFRGHLLLLAKTLEPELTSEKPPDQPTAATQSYAPDILCHVTQFHFLQTTHHRLKISCLLCLAPQVVSGLRTRKRVCLVHNYTPVPGKHSAWSGGSRKHQLTE